MDFCRNVSVAGEYLQPEPPLSPPCSANLDDLFSTHNTEVDVSLEWLSIFVEDCLTSTGNCLPVAPPSATTTNHQAQPPSSTTTTDPKPTNISKALHLLHKKPQLKTQPPSQLHKFVVPGKARSKRKKRTTKPSNSNHLMSSWTQHLINPRNHHMMISTSPDPLLLQQAYWLADSELIEPKKEEIKEEEEEESGGSSSNNSQGGGQGQGQGGGQARRCSHCLSQRTPQWRAGPLGPKTLCNACGVRYKSGRLLPEYRPAKSPTFVSYLHSNSHKKVMEMRTTMQSPFPTHQH